MTVLEFRKARQNSTRLFRIAVPLQAWSGPEGSRKSRFPDFMTTAQDGGKVVSLMHRPHLPPKKCSWYSFLLEAESTPRPLCDQKDFITMKFPTTPGGIEPATFRFVAQHLKFRIQECLIKLYDNECINRKQTLNGGEINVTSRDEDFQNLHVFSHTHYLRH